MGCPADSETLSKMETAWLDAIEYLRSFDIVDSEFVVNQLLAEGKKVLCEGAQGTMLDVDSAHILSSLPPTPCVRALVPASESRQTR